MVYAKKMANGTVENLLTYDYHPNLDKNDGVVIISKEEYEELRKEIVGNAHDSQPMDSGEISNTEKISSDADSNLHEESAYIDGIRKIPDVITEEMKFSKGEKGIDADGVVWVSLYNDNVYTPSQFTSNWEVYEP